MKPITKGLQGEKNLPIKEKEVVGTCINQRKEGTYIRESYKEKDYRKRTRL